MEINLDGFDEIKTQNASAKILDHLLVAAINQLDAVCDGATSDDGMGFASMHTSRGKSYAAYWREHDNLLPDMVNWAEKALPYYFNTQLSWIDKETFEQSIAYWKEKAATYEKELKTQREKITKTVENNMEYTINTFMHMKVSGDFLNSLQQWYLQRGHFSVKQYEYVKKAVVNHLLKEV